MTASMRDFSLSLLFVSALVFLLPEKYLTPLFIVFGQGHFILMYLYQFRAKKIGIRYIRYYILISTVLLTFLLVYPTTHMRDIFLLMSAVVFGLHFFFDELFVHNLLVTKEHILIGIGFGIQYVLVSYALIFGQDAISLSVSLPLIVLSWTLAAPLLATSFTAKKLSISELFLLVIVAIFTSVIFIPVPISAVQVLAFTVLFHYARWYLFYATRLRVHATSQRMRQYFKDTLIVNACVVAAYALFVLIPIKELGIFFSDTFFYFWTILHVIFSLSYFSNKK